MALCVRFPLRVRCGAWGRALALVLLGLWFLSSAGEAQARTGAAVLPSKLSGELGPREKLALEESLSQALREQQYEVASPAEREAIVQSEPVLKGCYNDACLEHLGRLLGVGVLVRAVLAIERPASSASGSWALEVTVFDVEVGAAGAKTSERCESCTAEQAAQRLGDLARRAILENSVHPRGSLSVSSEPPAGIVYLDGVEHGTTPYKRVVFAGPHRLIVKRLGYVSHQSDVEVTEDKKQSVQVKLVEGKDSVEIKTITIEKPSTPVYKKWWFWVAIVGTAAVAGGITAGVVLGKEVVPNGTPSAFHIKF